MHLVETSLEALMKTLAEEIPAALASYTGIIFNLCEIVSCFDKLPFHLSSERKVLTFTVVEKKKKNMIYENVRTLFLNTITFLSE